MRSAPWLLLVVLPAYSQQPPAAPAQGETPVFRTETSLALVRFHVVRDKRYVQDLMSTDVVLLEDGVPRRVTFFEGGQVTPRTVPVDVMALFDISGSVTQEGLLDPVVFKTTLLDAIPQARIGVYGFAGSLLRFCRPTRDAETLKSAFDRVLNLKQGSRPRPDNIKLQLPPKRKSDSRGGTWIFEAAMGAAAEAASWPGNATRMILMFSDGFATTTTRPEDVAPAIRQLGIPIYPVVLGHQKIADQAKHVQETGRNSQGVLSSGAQERLLRLQDQERDILEFASLGELTGGRSFDPRWVNLGIMRQILGAMVGQVQCEYLAGFSPPSSNGAPRPHKLEVRLRAKELGKVLGGTRTVVH